MVGYLQHIPIDDALANVNEHAARNSVAHLDPRNRNGETSAEFEHRLTRSFHESPYKLTHIWSRIGPPPTI